MNQFSKPTHIGGMPASVIVDIAKNTVDQVEAALMRHADLAPPAARPAIILNVAFQLFYRATQTLAMCEHMDIRRGANRTDEATIRYGRQLAQAWALYPDEDAINAAVGRIMIETLERGARHDQR